MLWTTQIFSVLFVQSMLEFAGVDRLFPYLVIANILGSLAPNLVTLYQQNFGGELSFEDYNGECFIYPPSSYAWVLIIPVGLLYSKLCFDNKGILCVQELGEKYGKYRIQVLFMFPAVLVLLNVPISIDKCNDDTVFPLEVCLYVLLKNRSVWLMHCNLGELPTRRRSGWRRHSKILFWGQWVKMEIRALRKQWIVGYIL